MASPRAWSLVVCASAVLSCSADNPQIVCPKGAACDPARDASTVGDDLARDDRPDAANDATAVDAVAPSGDGSPTRDAVATRELVSVRIEPPMATLTTRNGASATQVFAVTGARADGSRVTVTTGEWATMPEASAAGTIATSSGTFTATGAAGGRVVVTVTVARAGSAPLTATATLDVRVEREVNLMGAGAVTPAEAMRFFGAPRTADPGRSANTLYPLDGAVMPANVPPPDVQWERGAAGDLFLVRLSRPHVEARAWARHTGAGFRFNHLVDRGLWRALLETDVESPVTLAVDRFDAARGDVIPGRDVTLRIAPTTLSGAIYYWDLSGGRIQKIDAITGERDLAIPSPPPKPDMPDQGSRCVACHTVSRDGRYMSAELWGGDRPSTVFDLTSSMIRSDPAPTLFTPAPVYLFSTFSPDSRYLVTNRGNSFSLMERDTGRTIEGSGLPSMNAAHPSWSPDGMSLALITNVDGSWAVDFRRGDLALIPRTGETTFGVPRVIHAGSATPDRPVDAHPSFTPDSRWIAIQHGTNSRGANSDDRAAPMGYPGRLELVAVNATPMTPSTPLTRANGGEESSYWPNFSPFNGGGYFWLAFYSRRDYGNAQAGTRGTRRRQMWVTAISNSPRAGEDPSSVPYWITGQDVAVDNMSAYWAPVACRMNSQTCTVSAECCSGTCQRGTDGMFRCETPPMRECRRVGQTCSSDADCCERLTCFANVCGAPPG